MIDCALRYEATPTVADAISKIGRTEDLRLSPNNDRLAVTDAKTSKVIIFSIRIANDFDSPRILLSDHLVISSKYLNYPHGLAFLDNEHLVVANRRGCVSVFKISFSREEIENRLNPVCVIQSNYESKIKTPGSVDTYKDRDGIYRVLVCNNYAHSVTSHQISLNNNYCVLHQGILIDKKLRIPDGISVSPDQKWIAVSNHVTGTVLIYQNNSDLDKKTTPVGILHHVVCPHGLRFSPRGDQILVADAASQYLHIYKAIKGSWAGDKNPHKSVKILSDKTFQLGRTNPEEGGLKGIDIDSNYSLLITTCEHQTLGFFSIENLLKSPNLSVQKEISELSHQRDVSLRWSKASKKLRFWRL